MFVAKRSRKHRLPAEKTAAPLPAWMTRLDTEVFAILSLVAVWLLAMLLIDPRGDFPLNDDWCYGRAVINLVSHHEIRFIGITTMTLIAQVLWGALFCLIFGMSFTSLRLSTLTLGLAGILAVYALLKEIGAPRWIAVIGALVVGLNPIYTSLSYTFMTDVPFAAMAFLSIYAYVRALKRDSAGMIVLGTAFACAAVLIRQFGIILPIGFGLAYLVKNGLRGRSIAVSAIPVIVTGAILTGFVQWLSLTHRLPSYYNTQASYLRKFLGKGFVPCVGGVFQVLETLYLYLGLFLLPFLILTLSRTWGRLTPRQRKINGWISIISMPIVFGILVHGDKWMPVNRAQGDTIYDFGLGAPALGDIFRLLQPNLLMAPESFWIMVTIAGIIGGGLLLWHLMASANMLWSRHKDVSAADKGIMVLLLSITVMYLAPVIPLTAFVYFDRYFLCAVPLLIGVSVLLTDSFARPNQRLVTLSLAIIMLYGLFGVAGTHDYLSWNRLRWRIASEVMPKYHITPKDIDGGYEFNGWFNYQENNPKQKWWRNESDRYMITFGRVPAYDIMERYNYSRWMPPGQGELLFLRRMDVIHLSSY